MREDTEWESEREEKTDRVREGKNIETVSKNSEGGHRVRKVGE